MSSNLAIIDLGTNTFHLLLAAADENGYRITFRDRLAVKIGKGGINQGVITPEGLSRALVAMQSFRNIIEEHGGAEKIYAFGTSALRSAANREEVAERIRELTGIEVNIISGDEEAQFIYEGVRSAVGMGNDRSLIVDIGGGSVEFIIADQNTVFWKKSIEIGAQRLLELFHRNDPISSEEIRQLDLYFDQVLTPLSDALEKFPCHVLVGSSGSFDTFSDIFCARHEITKPPEELETPLSLEGFFEIYDELIVKNRAERMVIPGMIEMRVDMIVVASCLVRYLIQRWNVTRIRVSTYSLKEGVLSSLIHQRLKL